MERNGLVRIHGGGRQGKRRNVTLSARAQRLQGIGGLPVLGRIPAGAISEVVQTCDWVMELNDLLAFRPGDFLLIIEGDSMIGDGILPGDKVLLRPNLRPNDGEIAAVHVGDEYYASLKHVHLNRSRGIVVLTASNPAYAEVIVQAGDVRVVGVYRGLVRSTT